MLHRNQEPGTEIVGVEQPFDLLLIDLTQMGVTGWDDYARSIEA